MITDFYGRCADILKRKNYGCWTWTAQFTTKMRSSTARLDFLQQIKDHGGRYIFITNNSSKSVNDYVEKGDPHGHTGGL